MHNQCTKKVQNQYWCSSLTVVSKFLLLWPFPKTSIYGPGEERAFLFIAMFISAFFIQWPSRFTLLVILDLQKNVRLFSILKNKGITQSSEAERIIKKEPLICRVDFRNWLRLISSLWKAWWDVNWDDCLSSLKACVITMLTLCKQE